ncbi:Tetratricopeptide repeat protein [Ooceraea biroi]|uniref:Tetratricopeptide repeat protein n=1 Tax=Ooceraea biroi TaxID=2015173 RepID=A0A026W3Q5_OOCBI|nr:Tetratricopeptide repeat protein [Ooceraea biroi]
MIRSGVWYRVITVFTVMLEAALAVQHWRVTEHGRIQPQHDSVFDMRRPDDLMAFMEQEKRREAANAIYKKISRTEVSIDNQFMGLGMADVESSNSDCFLWDKSMLDVDVHASIVLDPGLRNGIDQSDLMLYNVAASDKQTVPDCQSTFSLDFSIYTFEHLKAMQNRRNLTQHKELRLTSYFPPSTDFDQFGHQLAYSLSRNRTSWIYLNLASIYWRIKGNAYNALECSRRAIVCAPRQYRDIPLLTTAGILHAAKRSGEAAVILHAAIDHNPTESYHHLALGHVYASLGDFDRSVACYDNCLKLSPDTMEAKQMKYTILCHRLLETTLLLFDQRLRNVLSEIHAYHDWKEEWFKLYERMLWEQDIKSATREIKLAFAREQNLQLLAIDLMEKSLHSIDNNVVTSYMDLDDRKKIAESMLQNVHLLHLLKNLQKQVKELNHASQGIMPELNVEYNHLFASPTKSPKYQNVEIKRGNGAFEAENWPKISDCDGSMLTFGDGKQYLPVYLSPENKGYATHLFVNELIDVEPGKKHPLPWRPPTCQTPKSYNDKYITRIVLDATVQQHPSDVSLKPFLQNLAQTADFAEIGQRILTATERKITAPWVLSMLASLYWRVVGKPRLALDCLQLALDDVPCEFRDVPLVSIASIHHKVGLIDDALRIADEALQTNAVEPMTNFLFGILLNVNGNYTGAMHYLKQALRVDPHLYDGRALMLLKTLACYEKFNVITGYKPGCDRQGINLHRYSMNLPSMLLTKYNLQASDILIRKRQVKNFKRVKYTSIKTEEIEANYHKVGLSGASHYDKEERKIRILMRQDLVPSLLLPNSATNLHEPYMDNIFYINELAETVRSNFYASTSNYVLRTYSDSTFGKITNNQKELHYPSKDECDKLKYKDWAASLFVFDKFLRRNMTVEDQIESLGDDTLILQPKCNRVQGNSKLSPLIEVEEPQLLENKVELDMVEWLMMITGTRSDTLQGLGTKIAFALQKNYSSWTLTIAASFYWRVIGDSRKALDCMLQSQDYIPNDMKDIFLINLASLLNSQNYFQDALKAAEMALSISPNFVVNHYVLANLHAALGNFKIAASYYKSSLELDPNFEPAITRLRVIQCFLFFDDKVTAMSEILLNIL